MTVFNQSFMFFDNPRGGTDQMDKAKAAGYLGGFGNVVDYEPAAWDAHRASARANGMFFGPWGRTGHPPPQGVGFEREKAETILDIAFQWNSPAILNCEKEIDNTGSTITSWIKSEVGTQDVALSCEAWPFGAVDWGPVSHLPVLPQIFPQDWQGRPTTKEQIMSLAEGAKKAWHQRGVKCVYFTFGTYGGYTPAQFELKAPFSLYTADAIGISNYQAWKPTSSGFVGCQEAPVPVEPTPKQIRAEIVKLTDPWTKAHPKDGLARITIIDRIAEEFFTDAEWKAMAPAIKGILDQGVAE